MRVLVLGAGGMAGHVVSFYLRENGYMVDTLSLKNKIDEKTVLLDVTDPERLKGFLNSEQYEVIINCIGLLVKESEARKDLAVYLNSYFPHLLEHHYQNTKTKVIHLSTDYVFSAKSSGNDRVGFYDRTKSLGELDNYKDLTFRMSIVGPDLSSDGQGLFNWFFQQKGTISGYDKVTWNGITTLELAKAIKAVIEQQLTGIYHLVSETGISKFELLKIFTDVFGRSDITIKPNSDTKMDRRLKNTRRDFNYRVSDYKNMVEEMKQWIESHKDLYPHYQP